MAEHQHQFPSTPTDLEDVVPELVAKIRHLGDLYGPQGVVEAARAVQDEIRVAGSAGLRSVPPSPSTIVTSRITYVAAVLAAAGTFAEHLHLTFDAVEARGLILELRTACNVALDLDLADLL